jgi:peptidoglycan/xylan/chitin deacetylase (PgdA/CDA1 family)
MAVLSKIKDAWRKNAGDVLGLFNGALPGFIVARRPAELAGIPVFHYHLVEPEFLAADLEFLKANGYRTLRSVEFTAHLTRVRPAPPRSVLLTFDDGPRNFHDVAFPLLRDYQAHAIAFIAPGLHADAGPEDGTDARPMTWQEVARVHASGLVEFQSHTLESRYVPAWPAPAALAGCDPAIEDARRRAPLPFEQDLAASRRMIEERLPGAKIDQLCFPMYDGTPAAIASARSLGFSACYWGLIPGRALNKEGDSPYFVSRMSGEYLRRLPGSGRLPLSRLFGERLERARAARRWRQRFAAG